VTVIPAIDLLGGKCVRLYQGDYSRSTVYDYDPTDAAKEFAASGARRIHLVDLDAARGDTNNRDAIRRIRGAVSCVLEVGGGVRAEEDIRELLDIGVDRVIVGTMMIRRPELVAEWAGRYPGIIAGIDALAGVVRVSGWESSSSVSDEEAAVWAAEHGMCSIVYTDISRDGTMEGASLGRTSRIAEVSGLPVILSGGVRGPEDVEAASKSPGIVGVITGRALYEGKIDLRSVIERFQTEEVAEEW
jgi:phosphoribosylformimino-5-aminoimidazole carboxamide ribotide isomerase